MFIYDKEIFRRPKQIFSRKGHHIFFDLTRAIAAMLQRIKNLTKIYKKVICNSGKLWEKRCVLTAAPTAGVKYIVAIISFISATVKRGAFTDILTGRGN